MPLIVFFSMQILFSIGFLIGFRLVSYDFLVVPYCFFYWLPLVFSIGFLMSSTVLFYW